MTAMVSVPRIPQVPAPVRLAVAMKKGDAYSCSSVVVIVSCQQSGDPAFPVHSRIVVS